MKITTRTILRILRVYQLADDQTAQRSIDIRQVNNHDSYIQATFVFNKRKFVLFFGTSVDVQMIEQLWPDKSPDAIALPNPLDPITSTTPYLGKNIVLFELQPQTQRLDNYLAKEFDTTISRSLWQKYISAGYVQVNHRTITSVKEPVSETDVISFSLPEQSQQSTDLSIIYEDSNVVVIDKPAGLLTHAKGGIAKEQTVADIIRHKTTYATDTDRPGIIHRLDRDTSGVLIVARNPETARFLQKQFADRRAEKTYFAVVSGVPKLAQAKIDLPIGRNPLKPSTFRVDSQGKSAQTIYRIVKTSHDKSLVELKPQTGRTHQLRVHMAHIGTPIIGDRVYGNEADRLYLHAHSLTISLPNGERKTFSSTVPKKFEALVSGTSNDHA